MTLKVCGRPGCPRFVGKGRGLCDQHQAEARARRGDPPGQYEHQQVRARLLPLAIGQPCPMCGDTMTAGQPLDLDHTVARAVGGTGPGDRIVHATCNRREGGRLARQRNPR